MKKKQEVITQTILTERISPHPRNYNKHSPEHIASLRRAIQEFGYIRRIVVQAPADLDEGKYIVTAGNGIFEALVLEGYKEIECTVIPSTWAPQRVSAYLAADNKHAEGSDKDDVLLLSLLKEINDFDEQLVRAAGYDELEFEQMLRDIAGEIDEEVSLRAISNTEPPEMAWVLVGVKLVQYGSIASLVDQLAAVPDVLLETTVSN